MKTLLLTLTLLLSFTAQAEDDFEKLITKIHLTKILKKEVEVANIETNVNTILNRLVKDCERMALEKQLDVRKCK